MIFLMLPPLVASSPVHANHLALSYSPKCHVSAKVRHFCVMVQKHENAFPTPKGQFFDTFKTESRQKSASLESLTGLLAFVVSKL